MVESEDLTFDGCEGSTVAPGAHERVQVLGLGHARHHDRAQLVDDPAQEGLLGVGRATPRHHARRHRRRHRVGQELPAHPSQAVAVDGQEAQGGIRQRQRPDRPDPQQHDGVREGLDSPPEAVVRRVGLSHDDGGQRGLATDPVRDLAHGRGRRVAGGHDRLDSPVRRERQRAHAVEHRVEASGVSGHAPCIGPAPPEVSGAGRRPPRGYAPAPMATLHVALTPRDPAPARVAIVVDCIRATTTVVQALHAGYGRVVCVGDIDEARRAAAMIGSGAVLGGERGGVRIPGFDLGNSPGEYATPRGHTLVLSTTNGTRAILQSALEAEHVLAGALTCLSTVAAAAAALAGPSGDVAVRCAAVRGELALDDVYVAGRLCLLLQAARPALEATDGARTAVAVARAYAEPLVALRDSQSARDLAGTGLEADVERCAAESTQPVVARVVELAPGRAVLVRDVDPTPTGGQISSTSSTDRIITSASAG
jgi:2-phosphosulfolactate phosphatase